MSHTQHHLEGAVKNLLAFENHADTDGCPHCMTKHILTAEQLLGEEGQQHDSDYPMLAKWAEGIRKELPTAYAGDRFDVEKMHAISRKCRDLRLKVMEKLGIPAHKHQQYEEKLGHRIEVDHAH